MRHVIVLQNAPIVGMLYAGKDADRPAAEFGWTMTGVLNGPQCVLKHQSLLRIHQLRVDRRNPPRARIKAVDVGQQASAAPSPVRPAPEWVFVPTPGRHRCDPRLLRTQQLPEGGSISGSGKGAADADDRNQLVLRLGGLMQSH